MLLLLVLLLLLLLLQPLAIECCCCPGPQRADLHHSRLASCQGACLVKHNRVDMGGRLQGCGELQQAAWL